MRCHSARSVFSFAWLLSSVVAALVVLGGVKAADASCAKRNVLFVMDRSGSMRENNKFDDAKRIINSVTQQYMGKVRFGLETFSKYPIIEEPVPTSAPTIQRTLRGVKIDSSTEMVKAMKLAINHFKNVLASDTVKDRLSYVLLVTDGKPNPPPCPVAQVKALRKLKINGKPRDIKTYVVGFGNKVDVKCLNSLATAGGTALPGKIKYILASNSRDLSAAMNEIVGRAASQETCNGKDDDCDGYVDNKKGIRQDNTLTKACRTPCGDGAKTCIAGKWSDCSSKPLPEVCDGMDNNCDGKVDNGARCKNNQKCIMGKCRIVCRSKECPKGFYCLHGYCVPKGTTPPTDGGVVDKDGGSSGGGDQGGGIGCSCSQGGTPGQGWLLFALLFLFPLCGRLLRSED